MDWKRASLLVTAVGAGLFILSGVQLSCGSVTPSCAQEECPAGPAGPPGPPGPPGDAYWSLQGDGINYQGNVSVGSSAAGVALPPGTGTALTIAGSEDRGVLELVESRTGQGDGLHAGQLRFISSENTDYNVIGVIASVFAGAGTDKGGGLAFFTKEQDSGDDFKLRMLIDDKGSVGIGTPMPTARLDVADGGIRTQSAGKLIVEHDGQLANEQVFWDPSYVTAHQGETFVWVAQGPNLKDTSLCANNASHVVGTTDFGGQYMVTLHSHHGDATLVGQWQGWHMALKDANGDDITAGLGRVFFALRFIDGVWRVDHMSGVVSETSFQCF